MRRGSRRGLRRLAPRLAATVLALGVAAWSAVGLYRDVSHWPVLSLAAQVSSGRPPEAGAYVDVIDNGYLSSQLVSCSPDLIDAAVTLASAAADAAPGGTAVRAGQPVGIDQVGATQANEPGSARSGLDRARLDRHAITADVLRTAATCRPFDGNVWLRQAILEAVRSGPSPTLLPLLQISYRGAPNDFAVLAPRLGFASQLYADGLTAVAAGLSGDVGRLVADGRLDHIAAAMRSAPRAVRPMYDPWVAQLDPSRRTYLEMLLARPSPPSAPPSGPSPAVPSAGS